MQFLLLNCKGALFLLLFTSSLYGMPFREKIARNSLLKYAKGLNSQYGEEGVIDEVMRRIGVKKGFLVEFGGYDGITMSNTRFLAERGWQGVFIESNEVLFRQMMASFYHLPNILCLQEFITPIEGSSEGSTIDEIADRYFPDQEIDVMSIDIDGLDHLIFKSLKRKPKLIIIEGGMFWHPQMEIELPDEVAAQNVQQPIIVMTRIAQEKGYELICSTFNAFFIRRDLYHRFKYIHNDPSKLWWEAFYHIKKSYPDFYHEMMRVRKTSLIQEWERQDPRITFAIS